MKNKLIIIATCIAFLGCANGRYHTGSGAADAALTNATAQLAGQLAVAATKIAAGQDYKEALVQASGDALRSLEGVAVTAVQPVITERLNAWVPKTPEWQGYAKSVAKAITTYVEAHGNNPAAINAGLELAATALNTF